MYWFEEPASGVRFTGAAQINKRKLTTMELLIENLVFQGGGVKGIAYAGALNALENMGINTNIKRCAGTSAGSIVATLISIGYDSTEISAALKKTNFKQFKANVNPIRLFTKYGLYSSDKFAKWLTERLAEKNLPAALTFAGLKALKADNQKIKDLYVFASNLSRNIVQGFSADVTPDVKIVDAVKASMSIPFFFNATTVNGMGDDVFVDGGLVYNYPISVFDNAMFLSEGEEFNPRTLGFYLDDINHAGGENELRFKHPVRYMKELIGTMLDTEVINFKRRKDDMDRTVFLDDLGISATNFDITDDQVNKLQDSGFKCTMTAMSKKLN
jgi:NTE family protein